MGFLSQGTYIQLPWRSDFEIFLAKAATETDKYSGEDLLHQIHIEAIESKLINLRLHMLLRRRFLIVIGLQIAMFAYLALR